MSATIASIVGVRIRHQLRCVAADRREAADRVAEAEEVPETLRNGTAGILRGAEARAVDRGKRASAACSPCDAVPANIGLAEQEVDDHADKRQGRHDQDPGDA